jgi:hypothetical protein
MAQTLHHGYRHCWRCRWNWILLQLSGDAVGWNGHGGNIRLSRKTYCVSLRRNGGGVRFKNAGWQYERIIARNDKISVGDLAFVARNAPMWTLAGVVAWRRPLPCCSAPSIDVVDEWANCSTITVRRTSYINQPVGVLKRFALLETRHKSGWRGWQRRLSVKR